MSPAEYLASQKEQRLAEYFEFLRFKSVSAQSSHKQDVIDCANWVRNHLEGIGMTAEVCQTDGHPVVYAERIVSDSLPTVLIYGHYDVQPPEPLELWKSGPFEPVLVDGVIYARGATDDKGQVFAHIKAIESHLKSNGELPLNVKFMIEGEEEVSSANLPKFIENNLEKLKADIVVVSDGSQFAPGKPAVTYGLRGIVFIEVKVTGPNRDVHSGSFGGAIENPINALCEIIAGLKDENRHITVDGYYDDVDPVTDFEKESWKKLKVDEAEYAKGLGIPEVVGEKGFTTLERTWRRPTLDINGITGGYQGEGAKTIIPSWATCKITMRMVPSQDPDKVSAAVVRKIKELTPKGVTVEVFEREATPAVETPTDGPWLEAAGRALKTGFGVEPLFMKEGGSIPVVGVFKELLGLNTLLLGFGQHDDNAHSPNEKYRYEDFEGGCRTAVALLDELAKVKSESAVSA
jgi:acetylornithine deacetylase/succinyl-diaminopimelate desuccinylase-like protein